MEIKMDLRWNPRDQWQRFVTYRGHTHTIDERCRVVTVWLEKPKTKGQVVTVKRYDLQPGASIEDPPLIVYYGPKAYAGHKGIGDIFP